MKAVLVLLVLAGCNAGVRTSYRGAPPPPCSGARPFSPTPAPARTVTAAVPACTEQRS